MLLFTFAFWMATLILFTELHPCSFCKEATVMFYMFHFKIIGTRQMMQKAENSATVYFSAHNDM